MKLSTTSCGSYARLYAALGELMQIVRCMHEADAVGALAKLTQVRSKRLTSFKATRTGGLPDFPMGLRPAFEQYQQRLCKTNLDMDGAFFSHHARNSLSGDEVKIP